MKALMIMFLFVCSLSVFAEPAPSTLPAWARLKGPILKNGKVFFIGKSVSKDLEKSIVLITGNIAGQINIVCGVPLKFKTIDAYAVNEKGVMYGYQVATVNSSLCNRAYKATPLEQSYLADPYSVEILRQYNELTKKGK